MSQTCKRDNGKRLFQNTCPRQPRTLHAVNQNSAVLWFPTTSTGTAKTISFDFIPMLFLIDEVQQIKNNGSANIRSKPYAATFNGNH